MNTRNNEKTQLDVEQHNVRSESDTISSTKKNKSFLGKAVTGLGIGVLLGSTTSFVMANVMDEDVVPADSDQGNDNPTDVGNITDGSIQIASGVSDDMSFSDAFSVARTELGPGGVFEWRGNIYGTYTADEWNNMSVEEKNDYFSHFNWNASTEDESVAEDIAVGVEDPVSTSVNTEDGEEVFNDSTTSEDFAENSISTESVDADDVEVLESTPEVEVLGVEQDPDTGANYAGLVVDGQEVVLIDVDGADNQFDYIAVDFNNDGQITDDEIADISSQHIEVSQFENDLYANDQLFASAADDVATDYINDDNGCDMA